MVQIYCDKYNGEQCPNQCKLDKVSIQEVNYLKGLN